MSVTASDVKALREKTGAGMMDCKKALAEAGGDLDKAIEVLRKMGLKDISKREGKVAAEGTVGLYSHAGGQVCAMVELNCETDFVARGEDFKEAARGIAMHVAAMSPSFLNSSEVPQEILDKEKEIILETLNENQKKEGVVEKILDGKIKKYFEENVLLNQLYIKDDSGKNTVEDIIKELSTKCGEKVSLRRFSRFGVGEGIEKKEENFIEEVASTLGGN